MYCLERIIRKQNIYEPVKFGHTFECIMCFLFQNKCTPLHLAARNGDDEIVQVLFEHKPPLLELNQVSCILFE